MRLQKEMIFIHISSGGSEEGPHLPESEELSCLSALSQFLCLVLARESPVAS